MFVMAGSVATSGVTLLSATTTTPQESQRRRDDRGRPPRAVPVLQLRQTSPGMVSSGQTSTRQATSGRDNHTDRTHLHLNGTAPTRPARASIQPSGGGDPSPPRPATGLRPCSLNEIGRAHV